MRWAMSAAVYGLPVHTRLSNEQMKIMKKIFYLIPAMLLTFAMSSCGPKQAIEAVKAKTVTVTPSVLVLQRGGTTTLSANVLPVEVPDRSVVWSSLDPAAASVEADGFVKALRPGVTYIVATSADGNARSACRLTVEWPEKYYVNIQDSKGQDVTRLYLYPTATASLKAVSSDGNQHTFTWLSTDSDAVAVKDGAVTFNYVKCYDDPRYLYYGKARIIAETEDTFNDSVEACSNIRAQYSFNGTPRNFEGDYGVAVNASYTVGLLYSNGAADALCPVNIYEVSSSNASAVAVTKTAEGYKLSSGSKVGEAATISVKLSNGESHVMGRYIVSASVTGETDGYTEDDRK